jgi:hypothetical protein
LIAGDDLALDVDRKRGRGDANVVVERDAKRRRDGGVSPSYRQDASFAGVAPLHATLHDDPAAAALLGSADATSIGDALELVDAKIAAVDAEIAAAAAAAAAAHLDPSNLDPQAMALLYEHQGAGNAPMMHSMTPQYVDLHGRHLPPQQPPMGVGVPPAAAAHPMSAGNALPPPPSDPSLSPPRHYVIR